MQGAGSSKSSKHFGSELPKDESARFELDTDLNVNEVDEETICIEPSFVVPFLMVKSQRSSGKPKINSVKMGEFLADIGRSRVQEFCDSKTSDNRTLKCQKCNFKTDSVLVMSSHLEIQHISKTGLTCSFCAFATRSPRVLSLHTAALHKTTSRIERASVRNQCPYCSYEDKLKANVTRHVKVCEKKFEQAKNLEPDPKEDASEKRHFNLFSIRWCDEISALTADEQQKAADWIHDPHFLQGLVEPSEDFLNQLQLRKKYQDELEHTSHNNTVYICDFGGCFASIKDFQDKRKHMLKYHRVEHNKMLQEPVACDKCPLTFITTSGLETHKLLLHQKEVFIKFSDIPNQKRTGRKRMGLLLQPANKMELRPKRMESNASDNTLAGNIKPTNVQPKCIYKKPSSKSISDTGNIELVRYKDLSIMRNDVLRLKQNTWVNDNIIDYWKLIIEQNVMGQYERANTFVFSTMFYAALTFSFDRATKLTRNVDLFQKDFIFIPINKNRNHWILAAVCFPGRVHREQIRGSGKEFGQNSNEPGVKQLPCLLVFDSLNQQCVKSYKQECSLIRQFLQHYFFVQKGEHAEFTHESLPEFVPEVQQQTNNYECGIFLLSYLELWFKNPIITFALPIDVSHWPTIDPTKKRYEIYTSIQKLHIEKYPDHSHRFPKIEFVPQNKVSKPHRHELPTQSRTTSALNKLKYCLQKFEEFALSKVEVVGEKNFELPSLENLKKLFPDHLQVPMEPPNDYLRKTPLNMTHLLPKPPNPIMRKMDKYIKEKRGIFLDDLDGRDPRVELLLHYGGVMPTSVDITARLAFDKVIDVENSELLEIFAADTARNAPYLRNKPVPPLDLSAEYENLLKTQRLCSPFLLRTFEIKTDGSVTLGLNGRKTFIPRVQVCIPQMNEDEVRLIQKNRQYDLEIPVVEDSIRLEGNKSEELTLHNYYNPHDNDNLSCMSTDEHVNQAVEVLNERGTKLLDQTPKDNILGENPCESQDGISKEDSHQNQKEITKLKPATCDLGKSEKITHATPEVYSNAIKELRKAKIFYRRFAPLTPKRSTKIRQFESSILLGTDSNPMTKQSTVNALANEDTSSSKTTYHQLVSTHEKDRKSSSNGENFGDDEQPLDLTLKKNSDKQHVNVTTLVEKPSDLKSLPTPPTTEDKVTRPAAPINSHKIAETSDNVQNHEHRKNTDSPNPPKIPKLMDIAPFKPHPFLLRGMRLSEYERRNTQPMGRSYSQPRNLHDYRQHTPYQTPSRLNTGYEQPTLHPHRHNIHWRERERHSRQDAYFQEPKPGPHQGRRHY